MSEEVKEPYVKVTLTQIYNEVLAQKGVMSALTEEVKKQNHLRQDIDKINLRCKENLYGEEGLYHKLARKIETIEGYQGNSMAVGEGKKRVESAILRWAPFIFGLTGWIALLIALTAK